MKKIHSFYSGVRFTSRLNDNVKLSNVFHLFVSYTMKSFSYTINQAVIDTYPSPVHSFYDKYQAFRTVEVLLYGLL